MKMLCLDGGGVFGKLQSRIMSQSNVVGDFDAYAGTSIGSVLALAYALGREDLVAPRFFDVWMPKVFSATWFRKNLNIFVPKYPDCGLEAALKTVFGTARTLGDCIKPVFVTATDIANRTLRVFSSENEWDRELPIWEVARSAVAAETYFAPFKGFADGGIFANNPSMVGVSALAKIMGVPLGEIEVLSVGTGESGDPAAEPRGRISTALWVVKAMLTGSADKMHDYFVRSLPLKKYTRIQFALEKGWRMDSPSDMDKAEKERAADLDLAVMKTREFFNGE